jgi:DNA-binding NarL/FixJ family response regulator
VLIVDDHQLFRNGLKDLLSTEPNVEICGEASDFGAALELLRSTSPDLVTVDISLAAGNGLDLVERIKCASPSTAVLVISMYDEAVYSDRALSAGASGYVCKQAKNDDILDAVRTVRSKGVYLSQQSIERLMRRGAKGDGGIARPEADVLSARELEILTLIGQGQSTQSIAKKLHLAVSTIETYRERIKEKLGLANAAELTRHAILWVMQHT